MKNKIINCLTFITFMCSATCLFIVKNKVEGLSIQFAEINKQILSEQHKIHLLKAEIAYLASPEVLKNLASNGTDLQVVSVDQIIADPLHQKQNEQNKNLSVAKNNFLPYVNRRFKTKSNQYLQKAVMKK